MATTVAQHTVATFTSPVNGTTPIDANTVRGNDNTIRTAYNDHDSDPGIHVQSSTLASRPVAGTAGRKWITTDAGAQKLWYDDGTDWHEVGGDSNSLYCKATESLVKGDIVKVTGYNTGQSVPEVAKVSSASDVAFGIVEADIANGSLGYVINTGVLQNVNTNSFAIGNILYPNTSGGLTTTKPTSGNYQPVAYVLRANTNNGVLYVEFSAPRIVEVSANTPSTVVLRDASGNFSAGTITAALTGNADTATKLSSARTFALTGDITGSVSSDLTSGASIATSIAAGVIVDADINASAAIADTKLATISTAGKVSNSATTATSANTASAIVARDGSGNFSAGTITATLNGAAPAGSLSGSTLASGVTASSLTSVGTLTSLAVSGDISIGAGSKLKYSSTAYFTPEDNSLGARIVTPGQFNVATGGTSIRMSLDTSGNLAVDTNTLYVDAANNRVGVGTASPGFRSTIQHNFPATFTNAAGDYAFMVQDDAPENWLGVAGQTTTDKWVGLITNGSPSPSLVFGTGGSVQMRLDTSGNLGLGVTPSAWGSGIVVLEQPNGCSFTSHGVTPNLWINTNAVYNGSAWVYKTTGNATAYQTFQGQHRFYTAASGTAGATISFTQAMTLDASSNLTILGAFSGKTLELSHSTGLIAGFNSTAANGVYTEYRSSGTVQGDIGTAAQVVSGGSTSDFAINARGSRNLVFGSSNTERARITSAGAFLVGTTTDSGRITVNVDSGTAFYAQRSAGANGYVYLDFTNAYTNWYSLDRYQIVAGGSGGVYLAPAGTSWTAVSDERQKVIIEPITNAATKVSALRSVIGRYKTDDASKRRSFLIAQDVAAVLPEAVDATDADNLGVAYSDVIPLLVAAIKELTARVAALEA